MANQRSIDDIIFLATASGKEAANLSPAQREIGRAVNNFLFSLTRANRREAVEIAFGAAIHGSEATGMTRKAEEFREIKEQLIAAFDAEDAAAEARAKLERHRPGRHDDRRGKDRKHRTPGAPEGRPSYGPRLVKDEESKAS